MRLATLSLASVLLSATVQAVRAAPPLSPASIEASIRQDGAKGAVDALGRSNRWQGVERRIGSGDARWIALAPKLAPGTDAGASEGLGIALAFALPRNPRAVLAVLGSEDGPRSLTVGRVCGAPFIEDTVKDVPAYRRRAVRAVRGVWPPSLARVRAACLRTLAAS